jgi:hypothetical protein
VTVFRIDATHPDIQRIHATHLPGYFAITDHNFDLKVRVKNGGKPYTGVAITHFQL